MKLFVLGGTGLTGRRVIEQGLSRGHDMTALTRPGAALAAASGLTIATGDPRSPADLAKALPGHEVAISVLGHRRRSDTILADSARALIEAMAAARVSRALFVSQGLLFPSRRPLITLLRVLLAPIVADSTAMEAEVRASAAVWTIVRPPRLTNAAPPRGYHALKDRRPPGAAMDRASLAAFLLDEAERAEYPRAIVGVGPRQGPSLRA